MQIEVGTELSFSFFGSVIFVEREKMNKMNFYWFEYPENSMRFAIGEHTFYRMLELSKSFVYDSETGEVGTIKKIKGETVIITSETGSEFETDINNIDLF